MLKPSEELKGLALSFTLDDRQRGIMAAAVKQEWFDILQKLMEEEIRLLNNSLINSGTDAEILANHRIVKGAGMFYVGVIQRLSELVAVDAYLASGIGTPENPEKLPLMEEFGGGNQ